MSEVPNRPCGCPINAEHDPDCPGAPRMRTRRMLFPGSTVGDLMDWLMQNGLAPRDVEVRGGQLKWESPETPEERQQWDEFERERAERTANWERRTYERLKAKFEGES